MKMRPFWPNGKTVALVLYPENGPNGNSMSLIAD